jgi:hypothetical protein
LTSIITSYVSIGRRLIETARSSETSVPLYWSRWRHTLDIRTSNVTVTGHFDFLIDVRMITHYKKSTLDYSYHYINFVKSKGYRTINLSVIDCRDTFWS